MNNGASLTNKEIILSYIVLFWQGLRLPIARRVIERYFQYNSEAVTMKGSYYTNGTGGGWYHAE